MGEKTAPPESITSQEMQELLSGLPQEVSFRYSNRFVFYLVWIGGWMLFALWGFFFGEGFTDSVAIPMIDRFDTAGFVGVMLFIVGSYVGFFLFFFFLARKITDKCGTACFHNDFAEIDMGRRRLEVAYGDIRKLNTARYSMHRTAVSASGRCCIGCTSARRSEKSSSPAPSKRHGSAARREIFHPPSMHCLFNFMSARMWM